MSTKRIRDPLHDLIEFSRSELERTLWDVIETRPFQRLRRIKQLGFTDLVYPGASHSRFAHSVGVFHTARQLMKVVRDHVAEPEPTKENKALTAALIHDLGHGPFSHAFEEVGRRLGLKFANHETTSDALICDSEVTKVLFDHFGRGFAEDVADILKKDGVKTVHHAVVSSQFDADRLDYMRRDRLMTGTQHAAIDFSWLIANLKVAPVSTGVDDAAVGQIETFILGPKAFHAAEAYVLGLFQLYPTVYLHKTTRGAEKIFTELMVRVVELVRNGDVPATGMPGNHPIVRFALDPEDLNVALMLDDSVIWGGLTLMSEASDPVVADFSMRLRDRKLYKCYDIRAGVSRSKNAKQLNEDEVIASIDKCCAEIQKELADWSRENHIDRPRILLDDAERSPYKPVTQSKGPLDRIMIQTENEGFVDLSERSNVVAALKVYKLSRAYVAREDADAKSAVERIIEGKIKS